MSALVSQAVLPPSPTTLHCVNHLLVRTLLGIVFALVENLRGLVNHREDSTADALSSTMEHDWVLSLNRLES